MSAAADYLGVVGWKQYTTTSSGAKFLVGLYDAQRGDLIALIGADRLGQMRTGAVTGVAARWLARTDADALGLIGCGWQAESQLLAIAAVRTLRQVMVYSRDPDRRRAFAARMTSAVGIEVVPAESAEAAVANLPIVVTATTSRDPVLHGDWLAPGTLVCAVGSNWLNKAEVDVSTIERAHCVVCDSVECCRHEAGDFVPALEAGKFSWDRALNLSAILAGETPGRESRNDVILFKSVGMAIEDVAVANKLVELARAEGCGDQLPL
jgi:ornithine cyclodeaminase/alanine dehydrogenase